MVVIIALKHAALGFCLCDQQFTLDHCTCLDPQPVEAIEPACGCCPEADLSDPIPPEPCKDCMIQVSVDPGDFLWASDPVPTPGTDGITISLPSGFGDEVRPSHHEDPVGTPIRGSPPNRTPLYLRTQVLRL